MASPNTTIRRSLWQYLPRSARPGARKPTTPHYDHNLHSFPARTSITDRTKLTPDIRYQRGWWLGGGRI